MNFEFLPNEVLIECFEYLNGYDIFHSFDQLNNRFNILIRNIPLYFNFESVFNLKFYKKIVSDPNIQRNIRSIHLSNKNKNGQIDSFIRRFSLDRFPRLQSLTLTDVEEKEVEKLQKILPLISQLFYLYLIQPGKFIQNIILKCPISKFRILAVTDSSENVLFTGQISSITNITLTECYFSSLRLIMKNFPMLNYLKCEKMSTRKYENYLLGPELGDHQCIHLKELIVLEFQHKFQDLQSLIEHTPNLKRLTISSDYQREMIDAYRWEELITSLLPYLTHFQFKFKISHGQYADDMIEKFKLFQTTFWQEEHQWFVEYVIRDYSAEIYTIPYIINTYTLTNDLIRYSNRFNPFDNVTNLVILEQRITKGFSCRFSRITSLTLRHSIQDRSNSIEEYIESLKMIVNLSNLQYLDISNTRQMDMSYVLLEILKEASNLSSLKIEPSILKSLLDNNDLHPYLNKIIRKLTISGYSQYVLKEPTRLEQFCAIFSNIIQLKWEDCDSDYIPYFTDRLSKLSLIEIK